MKLDQVTSLKIVTRAGANEAALTFIYGAMGVLNVVNGSTLLGVLLIGISFVGALETAKMWELRKQLLSSDSADNE